MKKNRRKALIGMTLVMLWAVGCKKEENVPVHPPDAEAENPGEDAEAATEQTEQEQAEPKQADTVCAEYASDELLEQEDAYDEFIADSSEYQVKIAFSAEGTVTNFRFCAVNLEGATDDGKGIFSISEELYKQSRLKPEKPLIIGVTFMGDTPEWGITYNRGDGTECFYSLSQSGFDGSPILAEASLNQN